MTDPRMITEILTEGEDDWVHLGVIVRTVKEATRLTGEELLQMTLNTIEDLLDSGYMVAGQVGPTNFDPWPFSTSEVLARIERAWRALGREPGLGDICWFANTLSGDERARLAVRS